MSHNNRKDEDELEYARQNTEYLEQRRLEQRKVRGLDEEAVVSQKKRKWVPYCCAGLLMVTLAAMILIYYFVTKIKDDVFNEYIDKKNFLEQSLPQGKEELKKSLDQGERLLNDTQEKVDKAQDTYDSAKNVYDTGKNVYEAVK